MRGPRLLGAQGLKGLKRFRPPETLKQGQRGPGLAPRPCGPCMGGPRSHWAQGLTGPDAFTHPGPLMEGPRGSGLGVKPVGFACGPELI
eukprot:8084158-Pyramimonas_sp.AAC.1